MPRYKDYSYDQHKLLPIAFREQVLPGTFEYTLNYLIDHEVDLSVFEARYRNDETGAPAYDPGILLKIILTPTHGGSFRAARLALLPGEHHFHGPKCRYPAPFQHHRRIYFLDERRGFGVVSGCAFVL